MTPQSGIETTSAIPPLRGHPALTQGESMMIPLLHQLEHVPGPDIVINCPACGHRNAAAQTFESTERVKLLFFIPESVTPCSPKSPFCACFTAAFVHDGSRERVTRGVR